MSKSIGKVQQSMPRKWKELLNSFSDQIDWHLKRYNGHWIVQLEKGYRKSTISLSGSSDDWRAEKNARSQIRKFINNTEKRQHG